MGDPTPGRGSTIAYLHFLGADPGVYPGLLELCGEVTAIVQALPPAAALLDLYGATRYFDHTPQELAEMIRVRALALHDARATAAVAPNRMLAIMLADAGAPDRVRVLPDDPAAIASFLRPKPAVALYGVGPGTARTLARLGLDTIGAIADARLETLQRIVGGRTARQLHRHAHGIDDRPVTPTELPRSISAATRFALDTIAPAVVRQALLALTVDLAAQLRESHQVARTVSVSVGFADHSTLTRTTPAGGHRDHRDHRDVDRSRLPAACRAAPAARPGPPGGRAGRRPHGARPGPDAAVDGSASRGRAAPGRGGGPGRPQVRPRRGAARVAAGRPPDRPRPARPGTRRCHPAGAGQALRPSPSAVGRDAEGASHHVGHQQGRASLHHLGMVSDLGGRADPLALRGSRLPALGHLRHRPGTDRDLVVLTIAAAIHQRATQAGLKGEDVDQVPLAAPDDTCVLGALQASTLQQTVRDCPAAFSVGEQERALMLILASSHPRNAPRQRWYRLREIARDVLYQHAHAAIAVGDVPFWEAAPPLASRRPVLAAEYHRQPCTVLAHLVR